jgi:hypothetical protein
MDGFKNTTRMKYMTGGPVKKAMGGTVPATAATTARPTTTAATATTPNTAARTAGAPPQTPGASPQIVKSATTNTTTGVRTPSMFDRNASLQSFNAQARDLLNRGVPKAELVRQQGILRKLQMDNSSNSGQHSAALAEALRSMQAMVPKKVAKGGAIKMREGGVFNEKGKRATWAETAAEGRRMEGRKPPVEGISTRPTDSSGRRMTNEELGMTPGGVDPAKKKAMPKGMGQMTEREGRAVKEAMKRAKGMSDLERARMMARPLPRKEGGGVPAHSDRPMIRRKTGGLTAMPKGKC